jgi:hypothetical protein
MNTVIEITAKIQKLNSSANLLDAWESNDILSSINKLNTYKEVSVGYRAQCGSTHITQKKYRLWLSVLKEIQKQNIIINVENIKQKNAYATTNGGFWFEFKYTMQ